MTEFETSTPQTDINASRQPVVFTSGQEVFATSRDVASFFQKEVKHVHEAIRNIIAKEPNWGLRVFRPNNIKDLSGESVSHYDMTRDGLSILAMGFTGAKALRWKLKYLEAFNVMEAELRARPAIDPVKALNDPAALRGILLTYTEKVIALEAANAEMTPKADAFDLIANTDGLFNLTAAAKILEQPPHAFNKRLNAMGWIYKRDPSSPWLGYQDKVKADYLDHLTHSFRAADGSERSRPQVMITPRGLTVLAKKLGVTLSAGEMH